MPIMEPVCEEDDVVDAVYEAKGKIAIAAGLLGVSPRTVYRYANRWPSVKSAIREARDDFVETLQDVSELRLLQAVKDGRSWAIKYVLDTKGRTRGYGRQSTVEFNGHVNTFVDVSDKVAELEAILAEMEAEGGGTPNKQLTA